MAPQLENLQYVDTVIRMIGWPTFLAALVWAIRKWDAGQRQFAELDQNAKITVETVAQVKLDVDLIKSNHLAHLQDGITQLAASNDKAVTVLQNIDSGIKVLIDRTPRL